MKLITFSLWGEDPKYCLGAIENAKLAPEIYPGWTCRFYISDIGNLNHELDEFLCEAFNMEHVEVHIVRESPDWRGMFWRFRPAAEDGVEAFISRDCDSRLSPREAQAVEDWLCGPKLIHVMRDHPYHTAPILGGMWGAKRGAIPEILDLMDQWKQEDRWQTDQEFLRDIIWPTYKHKVLAHDNWQRFDRLGSTIEPFPSPRDGDNFVGAVMTAHGNKAHPEHHALIHSGHTRGYGSEGVI